MRSISSLKTEFSVNEKGLLYSLTNKETGHNYAGKGGLWRIIYSRGPELERMVCADDNTPEISEADNSLFLKYNSMCDCEGITLDIMLEIEVKAVDGDIKLSAKIENDEDGIVVREFHFPLVRKCNLQPDQRLILSTAGGERYQNPLNAVRSRHTAYMAKDNLEVRRSTLYPGGAAVNAFVLENDREGLYFGSHDTSFQFTLHLLAADNNGLIPMMVKYPFIKSGEAWNCEGYVLSPYTGSWHVAARKYRKWADSWFTPQAPLKMVKDMKGWQRLIMRHQYGEVYFRYDQLEEACRDGLEVNIDTVFMFGWHQGGHDSEYPDYVPDSAQGGKEELKKYIKKLQDAGGKLILYFNGQLIDTNTDFYRTIGHRISVKKENGSEHMETYAFSGNGTALREFGNKTFVTACFGCEEWLEALKSCVDTAIELGADSVFFDQLGWLSRPCCDPSHGHPVPFMNIMTAKAEMLRKVTEYAKSKCPEMPVGIEWLSDVTAQHADYIHNIQKPEQSFFLDWFRYIFPEIPISDRGIRDETDIQRRVNFSLLKGYLSDIEIYRCRKTIKETPEYLAYLKDINRIRDKYGRIILNGSFRDQDFIRLDNQDVLASCFTAGDELVVMLTQSSKDKLSAQLEVPGFELIETDGLNSRRVTPTGNDSYQVDLGEHGFAVLLLKKP